MDRIVTSGILRNKYKQQGSVARAKAGELAHPRDHRLLAASDARHRATVPALRHQLARPGARGPRAPSWDITIYLFSTKIKGTVFCPIATFVAKVR